MTSADQKTPSLGRDSLNLPNAITISRLILAVILFAIIDYDQGLWITGAVVFIVAAGTDALDGYIARKYGLVTVLGRILDPFVDKFIICGSFVFLLGKQAGTEPDVVTSGVTAWMVIIVIGREMFVTGLRGFLEKEGKDFSATWSGKIKMILQCVAVPASLISLSDFIRASGITAEFVVFRDVVLWATVAVTIWSGLIYIVRAIALLRD